LILLGTTVQFSLLGRNEITHCQKVRGLASSRNNIEPPRCVVNYGRRRPYLAPSSPKACSIREVTGYGGGGPSPGSALLGLEGQLTTLTEGVCREESGAVTVTRQRVLKRQVLLN
jgi:hypothetical protein